MYIYIYIYISTLFVSIICNICLLFAAYFFGFHVDHDVTNASFYLCLFLHIYIYAPVYVLECLYFY